MAAKTIKWLTGTIATVLSTELDALANNAIATVAVVDNSSNLYTMAEFQLSVDFVSAPTANTAVSLWFLRNLDGTNYETTTATASAVPPIPRAPDCVLPLDAVTTAQIITVRVPIPPGTFQVLLKNDGSGQAFPASGSTLKIKPLTLQSV